MININKVVLVDRLAKDVEVRKTQSNLSVVTFTVAVNRKYKNANGDYDADFINCVAWRQSADFLGQYALKGDIVAVEGSMQVRSFDSDKGKMYITEVVAESVQLITERKEKKEEKKEDIVIPVTREVNTDHVIDPKDLDLPFY